MHQIAATHPFIESLEHLLGFLVVVLVLTLLWALTALIGRFFIGREAAQPAAAGPAPEEAAMDTPAIADSEGPTDEEVAAISAALMTVMGQRSRIVSIRSSGAKDWSREGRREHFASHRIR